MNGEKKADALTDELLERLEDRIKEAYGRAKAELEKIADGYFADFTALDEKKRKLVESGKLAKEDYEKWRLAKLARGDEYVAMRNAAADVCVNADKVAAAYINGELPNVYAFNHNYAAYAIESGLNVDLGFTLYDAETVRRLISDEPDLLPVRKVDVPADRLWNQTAITKEITQGIMLGESVPKLAKRVMAVTDAGAVSAVRSARTAVTGAQNAGRVSSYEHAQKMGINVRKTWLSTLDGRTRHAHRLLDGQTAAVNEPFKVDGEEIMYPGDPTASPELVYNCRCTLIAALPDVNTVEPVSRLARAGGGKNVRISDMTYGEWEASKESSRRKTSAQGNEIIDKPTYSKITRAFLKSGGTIIRGKDAEKHLAASGAHASYIAGSKTAFIKDDATVSDVLEEMYHAKQDRERKYGGQLTNRVMLLREIDAQIYLTNVADKYKIPTTERLATLENLNYYRRLLDEQVKM